MLYNIVSTVHLIRHLGRVALILIPPIPALCLESSRPEIDVASAYKLINVSNTPHHNTSRTSTYLCPVDKLPADDRHNKNRNPHIRRHKITRRPVPLQEHREARNQRNNGRANTAVPRRVGLQWASPGQSVAVDALDCHGAVEAQVAGAEGAPGDEAGDGGEVEEPGEGLGCAA